jgi:hypothetical protein
MYKTMTKIYTIKDIGGNCLTTPIGFKSSNPNEKLDGVTYYPTATAVGSTTIAKYAANLNISTNYGYVTICVNSDTGWHLLGRDIIIPTISTQLFTTTTGQLAYDSTENLPMFYNGTFWQYLGMDKLKDYEPVKTSSPFSGAGITLQTEVNDGFWYIQISPPANNTYIEVAFGTLPKGVYKLKTTFIGCNDRGLIDITERTTSLTIKSGFDIYRAVALNTQNTIIPTDNVFKFLPSGSTGSMTIRYAVNGKNASSTNYYILIQGVVELRQIG